MSGETNLAEIIGRDEHDDSWRVADFLPDGDHLLMAEACDHWFAVRMNRDEVRRLINWLEEWVK